jgi:hypothetical protein
MTDQAAADRTHVILLGVLSAAGELQLQPGLTDDRATLGLHVPDNRAIDAVSVEVLGEDERLLARSSLATQPLITDGLDTGALSVLGEAPLPAAARRLRFIRREEIVLELPVAEASPTLELTWKPAEAVEGRQEIAWHTQHTGDGPLFSVPSYSADDGQSWLPLALMSTDDVCDVDFDRLPGGRGRIAVVVSDGVRSTRVESPAFTVPVKPCQARILAPADGAVVSRSDEVWLYGQGLYLEEDEATDELTWHSSLDGDLGEGPATPAALSTGEHTIELSAGHGERQGHTSISLTVSSPDAEESDANHKGTSSGA